MLIVTIDDLRPFFRQGYFEGDNYFRVRHIIHGVEAFIRNYTNNDFICRVTGEVFYPPDVRLGAINLVRWELDRRDKEGIASETISRHSVSYFKSSEDSAAGDGYPGSLLGFLKPYKRARF